MALVKLSDALKRFVGDHALHDRLTEGEVLAKWPEIAGEKIASLSEAVRCEAGELTVRVASAVWRKELQMLTPEVLEKLEAAFPGVVKKIVWR